MATTVVREAELAVYVDPKLDGPTVIRLVGELDLRSASALAKAVVIIRRTSNKHLVIDCADLVYIDSSGIAELMRIHQDLSIDIEMTIRAPRLNIQRIFDVVMLADVIDICVAAVPCAAEAPPI